MLLLVALSAVARAASPFDHTFALGGYAAGWEGSYGAGGLGGDVRIEPWQHFGVDLFGEAFLVETPDGIRHDHPVGFDAYVPVALGSGARLLPLFGACAVGSFIESDVPDAPGADDVLFGVHAGLAAELPVGDEVSTFVEGKAVGWLGHDRSVQGWSGEVGSGLVPFAVAQLDVGLRVHFGGRST